MFLRKLPGDWQKQPELLEATLEYASIVPIYLVLRPFEGAHVNQMMDKIIEIMN